MPKETFTPAEYSRKPPVDIGRPVKQSDKTDFFLNFIDSDQLGRIAVGHRVLADQRPEGTLDADCITLAELHSDAVDFSKTGIPVSIPNSLFRYLTNALTSLTCHVCLSTSLGVQTSKHQDPMSR
jgi:hypothetical protein